MTRFQQAATFTLVVASLLLAGCSSGEGNLNATDSDEPSDDARICEASLERILSWRLSDTYNPAGASGAEEFTLPSNTSKVGMYGSSGYFAQARWAFALEDDAGESVWNFEVTAPMTAIGYDNNVPAEMVFLPQGDYTFRWSVEGAIESLEVDAFAAFCV